MRKFKLNLKYVACLGAVALFQTGCGGGSTSGGSGDAGKIADLKSVEISTTNSTAPVGVPVQFVATAILNNNSKRDITNQVNCSSDNGSVFIDRNGVAIAKSAQSVTIKATINGVSYSEPLNVTDATLKSISISGNPKSRMPVGLSQKYVATGVYSDNSTYDLSGVVSWKSSDEEVAKIDEKGNVEVLKDGNADITAEAPNSNIAGSISLSGVKLSLKGIEVLGESSALATGLSRNYQAIGEYFEESTGVVEKYDMTSLAKWSTEDENIATVNKGVVNAKSNGNTVIKATYGEAEIGLINLDVISANIERIEIVAPETASIPVGLKQNYTAFVKYADSDKSFDITDKVTWISDSQNVLKTKNTTNNGQVIGVAAGVAKLTAVFGNTMSEPQLVTVESAPLQSIEIEFGKNKVADGRLIEVKALAKYSDDQKFDISKDVDWTVDPANSVEFIEKNGSFFIKGKKVGTSIITGKLKGSNIYKEATLTVGLAEVDAVFIAPHKKIIKRKEAVTFSAFALLSNGKNQNVTDNAIWDSSNEKIAKFSRNVLTSGNINGKTFITAKLSNVTSNQSVMQVQNSALQSVEVTPKDANVGATRLIQFHAVGHFQDGESCDLTDIAEWSHTNPNAGNFNESKPGLFMAEDPDQEQKTRVTATAENVKSTPTDLTVSIATLDELKFEPSRSFLYSNDETDASLTTANMNIKATYSNGKIHDYHPNDADWTISNSEVVTLDKSGSIYKLVTKAHKDSHVKAGDRTQVTVKATDRQSKIEVSINISVQQGLLIFVTKNLYTANLGGYRDAASKCNNDGVSHPGIYKALLNNRSLNEDDSFANNITTTGIPYYNENEQFLINPKTKEDGGKGEFFNNATLANPITTVTGAVWVLDGEQLKDKPKDPSWTKAEDGRLSRAGAPEKTNQWFSAFDIKSTLTARLYCVQQK